MTRKSCIMRPLTSDIHLYTAQMDRTPIVVFIVDGLFGSGKIEGITENMRVGGERYLREIYV